MAKLHELLAAEKTPTGAWNALLEDTVKKFKNPTHYFDGHSKSLQMIEDSPANKAIEGQAREEKPVTTTVYETLEYALEIYAKSEDLQYQKNLTNAQARGTVMWQGAVFLKDLPVDELLGLEARLTRIRNLFADVPTLDGTKYWERAENEGAYLYRTKFPEETTKTDKQILPVTFKEATKEHPAQVQAVQKDVVVGKFTTVKRSGAATTEQKSEAIKRVDDLLVEVKKARMRANETPVVDGGIAKQVTALLLEPFKV